MAKCVLFLTIALLLTGCSFVKECSAYEEFQLFFPSFSEEECTSFPEICSWKVKLSGQIKITDGQELFQQEGFYYFSGACNGFRIKVKRNFPASITALPITYTSGGKTYEFFKPAGFVYPYGERRLKWENGFCAAVMERAFSGSGSEGERLPYEIITSFNWKKLYEILEQRQSDSAYNPWHCNESRIAAAIMEERFSITALNSKNLVVGAEEIWRGGILSSYVPENKNIQKYGSINLAIGGINFFSIYNEIGIIIECTDSEKLSLKVVTLPTIIE